MPGCGELSAAKLVGETAGVTRFKSEAAFARHAGVAPIPVWSGNTAGRVRLTRSGNRQLNAALHRIAITQIRLDGLGQAYYRKRLAAAIPAPKRSAASNAAWPVWCSTTSAQTNNNARPLANRQRLDIGETMAETSYAICGDLGLAYQVFDDGPVDSSSPGRWSATSSCSGPCPIQGLL